MLTFAAVLALFGCGNVHLTDEPAQIEVIPLKTEAPAPSPSSIPLPTPLPTPVPTPTPTTPDPICQIIDGLTDEELVGQMVMCGFSGLYKPPQEFIEFVSEYKLGNIILFSWNIETDEQTSQLTAALNEINPVPQLPLFVSTDVEGGSVRRYESWRPNISSAKKLYERNNEEYTKEQFRRIADRLVSDGINMDLAPVLDISKNQDSTFLGNRIFGKDPERTSAQAIAAVYGLQEGGAISIGKHYPGHGGTPTDSHASTPIINKSEEEWREYDLIPFRNAFEAGIDGMLVGHLLFPEIDSEVSSVSYKFITEILREELGFEGMVMSDDMRMGGITKHMSCGEAAVRFIEAGGDMVLIGKYIEKQRDVFESIYAALESGRLSRERLEESVYRIIKLKKKYA